MKYSLILFTLLITTISFGQDIDTDQLWRTKGVYDSVGNFVERAKIQGFLYSSKSNQFYRLRTQDKLNMETGETKVFVYRDTLNLTFLDSKSYKISNKETLTLHTKDSLTIQFKGYSFPYTKINLKSKPVNIDKFKTQLLKAPLIESIDNKQDYEYTYQNNGLAKIKPLESDSEWESEYKIIDFNGFIILQGIVSAPKLITKLNKNTINFIQIDYRYKNKPGVFIKKQ